jgi:hypothetical protein
MAQLGFLKAEDRGPGHKDVSENSQTFVVVS